MANEFIIRKGYKSLASSEVTGSLTLIGDYESIRALTINSTKGTGTEHYFRTHGVNGENLSLYSGGNRVFRVDSDSVDIEGTFSSTGTASVGDSLTVTAASTATLILRGDSGNSGDAGQLDSSIKMLHDDGTHGILMETRNFAGKQSFLIKSLAAGTESNRFTIHEDNYFIFTGDIRPDSDSSHNIGTNDLRYLNGYFDNLHVKDKLQNNTAAYINYISNQGHRFYVDANGDDTSHKFQILSNTTTYDANNVVVSINQSGDAIFDGDVTGVTFRADNNESYYAKDSSGASRRLIRYGTDDNVYIGNQIGDLYYQDPSGTHEVYHEGHKPTLAELGAAADTVVNQTDFVSKASGGTFNGPITINTSTKPGLIVKSSGNSGQDQILVVRGSRNDPATGVEPAKIQLQSYDDDVDVNIVGGEFYMEATSETGTDLTDFEVGIRYRKDGTVIDGFKIHDGEAVVNGNLTATSLVKSGGASTEFLKADGSVDTSTYLVSNDLSGYLLNTTDNFAGNLNILGGNNNAKESFINVKRGDASGEWLKFQTDSTSSNNVSQFVIRKNSDSTDLISISTSTNATTFAGDINVNSNHIGRDDDNYIGFETDNQIKFRANGATQVKLIDGALNPQTDSDIDLGTNTLRYKNIYADNIYGAAQDLAVSANDGFGGTYSLLWHDGADVYSSSWLTVTGATDTLNVPNISTTGDVEVSGYFQVNSSAALLKKYVSGWNTGVQTHDILYNGWNSTVSDYTYLKAAGNGTGGHGIIVAGDTGTYMGTTDIETGTIANSATAPLTNTWAYFRDATAYIKGDTSFAGDVVVAGTLTAQEFHTEFVSASIIYESGSTKFGDTSDDNHDFTGSVNIDGTLSATVKSFDIEHPTQVGKRLVYGVLEGPEHAVYVRGESKEDTVILPEEWEGLIDKDTITVQLTSIGSPDIYYYKTYENNSIIVGGPQEKHYFYYVQATRKDVEPLITVQ